MKVVKARTKSKKNRKFQQIKFGSKESLDTVDSDLSLLRKPIDISVSSLLHVIKLLETGSDEVKDILAYECDIIYECRICHSLFRSLANFISHKRVYCKEIFNVTLNKQLINNNNVNDDETFTINSEMSDDSKSKENNDDQMLRSQVPKKRFKRDLTSVVDMLQKKLNIDSNDNDAEVENQSNQPTCITADNEQILLETMESNQVAVYQTVVPSENTNAKESTVHTVDLMKAQIIELQNMENQNTAVLNSDGQLVEINQTVGNNDSLQIHHNDGNEDMLNTICMSDLICSTCRIKFATKKTLTFHMKSLHVSHRMCYPCPYCFGTFKSTWSVYRHLFKVHRKTNEQVRKLRTHILDKAYRKETTGAEDLEKENELLKSVNTVDQQETNETQEWMDHLESDLELQRCGGCGRRFDRRAALLSHSQFCQRRIAACSEVARNKAKKCVKISLPENVFNDSSLSVETSNDALAMDIMKDSKKDVDVSAQSISSEDNETKEEMSIRVHNVSTLSEADWDSIGITNPNAKEDFIGHYNLPSKDDACNKEHLQCKINEGNPSTLNDVVDCPDTIYSNVDKPKRVRLKRGNNNRKIALTRKVKGSRVVAEKSNRYTTNDYEHITLFENKVATIANVQKLKCLVCNRRFTTLTTLRRHLAAHIGWNRYRCSLCHYKCFVRSDCVNHCYRMHNTENSQFSIEDMIVEIPYYENINKDVNTIIRKEIINRAKFIPRDVSNRRSKRIYGMNTNKSNAYTLNKETADDVVFANKKNNAGEFNEKVKFKTKVNKRKKNFNKRGAKEEIQNCEIDKNINFQDTSRASKVDFKSDLHEYDSHTNNDDDDDHHDDNDDADSLYQTESRLDTDSDLRRMVMEVIFGSSNLNLVNEPVANQPVSMVDGNLKDMSNGMAIDVTSESSESKNLNDMDVSKEKQVFNLSDISLIKQPVSNQSVSETNDKAQKMLNHETKDVSCESEIDKGVNVTKEEDMMVQRSVRNRVKHVDKNFIYDLNDITLRKEAAVCRGFNKGKEPFVDNKVSSKKSRSRDNKTGDVNVLTDRSVKSSELLLNNMIPTVVICRADDINGSLAVKKSNANVNTGDTFISSET